MQTNLTLTWPGEAFKIHVTVDYDPPEKAGQYTPASDPDITNIDAELDGDLISFLLAGITLEDIEERIQDELK